MASDMGKNILIFGALAVIAVPAAQYLGGGLAENVNQRERSNNIARADAQSTGRAMSARTGEIQTLSSRQSSDGVTNEDVSVELADAIGEYSVGRVRVHAQRFLDDNGLDVDASSISAESTVVPTSGLNLIITRFRVGEFTPMAQIMGIRGSELIRVMCISREQRDIPLLGTCNDAIQENLDVSLDPNDGGFAQ